MPENSKATEFAIRAIALVIFAALTAALSLIVGLSLAWVVKALWNAVFG